MTDAKRGGGEGFRKRGGTNPKRLTKHAAAKQRQILDALANQDLEQLRKLAGTRGGFLSNALRREVWPALLHCRGDSDPNSGSSDGVDGDIPRDAVQVELDVNRSLTHLLPPNTGGKRLARMRADLSGLIISVLQKHPYLHYYQGFHDVATVCLLVLKPVLAARCLESLALFYLRDYMTPTLQSALNQIHLLFPLLSRASPPIHTFLTQVDGLLPYFCLSWVITWYSHNINNAERIARLFDFMIASNPLMPIYIAAAVVISQKDLLLEEEPEYSSIHHFLSQFPANHNVEHLIKQAQSLYNSYPPHILQKIARQRLGKASCVTRHAQDIERLPFAEHSDGNRPKNLIQRHIADTTASTAPSRALGGRFASNAKQVAWLAAFAATTAIAWYALEIGAQYGYLA